MVFFELPCDRIGGAVGVEDPQRDIGEAGWAQSSCSELILLALVCVDCRASHGAKNRASPSCVWAPRHRAGVLPPTLPSVAQTDPQTKHDTRPSPLRRLVFSLPVPVDMDSLSGPWGRTRCPYPLAWATEESELAGVYG